MTLRFSKRLLLCLAINLLISYAVVSAQTADQDAISRQFPCVKDNIYTGESVAGGNTTISVKVRLKQLKARCRKGKLVDSRRREIRFFKAECWGNPPADYIEIQQQQQQELTRLKKKYTVIEIACGPSVMLTH
jgi:hypothetical protein